MKKILIAVCVVLLAFITIYLFDAGSDTSTIKIGVVSPLTGSKAQVGEGLREAIELARKDFGETEKHYEFIFEDSASDPARSASAVQKLVNIDRVNAFISITSQDSNMVSKAAADARIPHIAIANDSKVAKGEYNFIHWTPVETQVDLFLTELKKRNISRVGIFTEVNDSSVATVEAFKRKSGAANIEIIWEQRFAPGETDLRSLILKNKDRKVDLIMLQAFSPSIEILKRRLQEVSIVTPVSSITNIGVAKDLKVFDGVWYVSGGQPSLEFSRNFKKQTGYDPTIGAHYGYEITKIYLSIFESTTDTSGDSIRNKITNFDFKKFDSITGLSGMDEEGQFISAAATVIVKDGKNEEIK